jgi:hypothetical protein
MHQAPDPLFEAGFDDVFGDLHVALVKVLITSPQTDGTGAMHHGFDVGTQVAHQFGITQIALDELGAAPHQMLHPSARRPLTRTSRPCSRAKRAKRPPMKPLAPVTRIFMYCSNAVASFKPQAAVKNDAQALHSLQLDAYCCSNGTNHCFDARTN